MLAQGADANAMFGGLRPLHVASREPKVSSSSSGKRDAKGDTKASASSSSAVDAAAASASVAAGPSSPSNVMVEIAKALLEAGANPNLRDAAGSFPLHHAASHNADLVV